MRISWKKASGAVVVSAAMIAMQGVPALAQFVPYTPNANQQYNQYQAHTAPQYPAQQQLTQQQLNQQQFAQQQYAPQQYAQPQYTAVAMQGSGTRQGGSATRQEFVGPAPAVQAAPVPNYTAAPAADCNCQTPAPAAAPVASTYESYPVGGCASGTCGTYNSFAPGCGVGATGGYGGGGVLGGGYLGARAGSGRQWFGGYYGLFLQRTRNDWIPLAFTTDQPAPFYPARDDYVLNLQDVTETEHGGAEFRFGSTFGNANGCGPRHAWEAAYWGIIEEEASATFTDLDITAGDRLYLNLDFRGLEYDPDGAGPADYRPLNEYFSSAPPTFADPAGFDPIRLNSITVRNRFSAQNIEVNLLRLPGLSCCSSGCCGAGGCSDGCAGGCCGGGGCAGGSCGIGHGRLAGLRGGLRGRGGAGFAVGPRYSLTSLVGVRYLRLDEDFFLDIDAENLNTGASIPFTFASEADNQLVGIQLGCNGTYRLGQCGRWALHFGANAGIYGNHAEVTRSLNVPAAGDVRFVGGANDPFTTIETEDDGVATVAEFRVGGSYQYSCNWRLFGGYRALGVSGIALGFEQIPNDFSSPDQLAEYVNTSGSLFLHGLQAGAEYTY